MNPLNGPDTLIMVYMIGSDLESEEGAATSDLMEMLTGLENADPQDLKLVVAYGGSTAKGWKGMKIADKELLLQDSKNRIFGDEGYEYYSDESANMGSQESLSNFLSFIPEHFHPNRTILIFWDHGMAYDGFGVDENTGDELSIAELTSALENSHNYFEIIGFDACLMATLEVAVSLSPYAHYLVASEELVPGDGWKYDTWMQELASDISLDTISIGILITDSFMASESPGKTLSIIDLTRIQDIIAALDTLGSLLSPEVISDDGYYTLGRVFSGTTKFGIEPGISGPDMTMDLGVFVERLIETRPDLEEPAKEVLNQIDSLVVYERHDEYIPDARGIAIISPSAVTISEYDEKSEYLLLTPGWDAFFYAYLTQENNVSDKPEILLTDSGSYEISDPYAAAYVYADYYLVDEYGIVLLGSDPVYPDEEDFYNIPDWDGRWIYLVDPENESDYALLEFFYETTLPDGKIKYSSEIDFTRNNITKQAVLYTYLDPDSGDVTMSITPYTVRDNGDIIFSRTSLTPEMGDIITTYAIRYDWEMSESTEEIIGEISVTPDTDLVYEPLPDGIYTIGLSTEYDTGESSYAGFEIYDLTDGTLSLITTVDGTGEPIYP